MQNDRLGEFKSLFLTLPSGSALTTGEDTHDNPFKLKNNLGREAICRHKQVTGLTTLEVFTRNGKA
jgi:hypothetical protein